MIDIELRSFMMFAVLFFIPAALLVFVVRRRLSRTIDSRIRSSGTLLLHDFLLPDGNGGEIHFEYVLLTQTGIVVVDVKDVEGNVFGSDSMDEWTVINNNRRKTFPNPQHGLFDRLAAVKSLSKDVPVDGCIAFTSSARFSKGKPSMVVFFDTFVDQLSNEVPKQAVSAIDAFLPTWDQLVSQATLKGVAKALVE
jgi:hypothetical protein